MTIFKYIFCLLSITMASFGHSQDATMLAEKLTLNYDSCKQIILKLQEDEPYNLEDMFWLEQQLMQNMMRQESLESTYNYTAFLTRKYRGQSKEASALTNRGNVFYMTGEYEQAIASYDSAITVAKKSNNISDVARVNNNKAGCYTTLGIYDSALIAIAEATQSYEELDDTIRTANTLLVRGNIFYAQDILDEAISAYEGGLEKLSNHGDIILKANLLNNVALILNEGKQWRKAIDYLKEAIRILKIHNIQPTDAYTNLGESYRHINLDSASFYYNLCLNHAREGKEEEALYRALTNIGLVKEEMGNKREALTLYNEAFDVIDNNFDRPKIAQLLINLANIETDNKNYTRAKKMADLALEKSLERRELQHIQNSYAALSTLAKAQQDYEQALIFDQLRDDYKDSVLNESTLDAIAEYETKYQSALKDQLIIEERNDKLEAINKQKSAEAKKKESDLVAANRQKWIFGLAGGILAIAFLALFIIQRNRRKAQAEKDAALITERDKGLKAVINAQEDERKRISKDLHDGIGQQLSGLKMAWQNLSTDIGDKAPEEFSKLIGITQVLDDTATEVRSISHQMMPRALSEMGLTPAIQDMLTKSLGQSDIQFEFEHYQVDERFKENIEIGLYRITQELINNVIKHSSAKFVSVQLFKNKNSLILMVEDNGIGFKSDGNNGHGLMNIKSRLNTINGEVNYESSPESGIIATIKVPLNT